MLIIIDQNNIMLLYPLYCDIISLTSLKITQAFHLALGFVENEVIFCDFTIWNSVQITKGSDNRDSSTVFTFHIRRKNKVGSAVLTLLFTTL